MSNHNPTRTFRTIGLYAVAITSVLLLSGCSELFGGDPSSSGSVNRGIGEECDSTPDCRPGLNCVLRVCSLPADRPEGDPCALTGECLEGLYCQSVFIPGGSVSGVCAPAGDGEVGASCGNTAACARGNYCDYFGVTGICEASGDIDLGRPCTDTSECLAGLTCGPQQVCAQSAVPAGITIFEGAVCPSSAAPDDGPIHVLFDVPRSGGSVDEFYALPFPNDIRLQDGRVDLSGHAHPTLDVEGNLLKAYIDAIEQDIEGFGLRQAIFFRFNTFPDPSTIEASGDDATIVLVNIDPESSSYGNHRSMSWTATDGRGLFICNNWLGIRPFWSQPFDEDTTYAAIVTDGIRDGSGGSPVQSPDFAAVVGSDEPSNADLAAAWEAYAPLRDYLVDQDIDPDTIMGAAVFTTDAPTHRHASILESVDAIGVPEHDDLVLCDDGVTSPCDDGLAGDDHVRGCFTAQDGFYEIHTRVDVPIYQEGTAPYLMAGGSFIYDEDGSPLLQRTEGVCAAITVPKDQTMPESGWPVVVHAHGTGGNFRGFVDRYVDDLSAAGFATIGFDGVQHGDRRGDSLRGSDVLFFNYTNPRAARGNVLQGMVDVLTFARFAEGTEISASNSPTGEAFEFDDELMVFFGHSQGATVGVPALAIDGVYDAAVLSGVGGGLLLSLLEKTKPLDIASGVQALLQSTSLNDFHPMLNLVQLYFEQVETLNFAAGLVVDRPDGTDPYHVFMTYGIDDSYTPNRTTRELVLNSGLAVIEPVIDEMGRPKLNPPVSGNISVGEDSYTGVVGQYEPSDSYDGHHVIWYNDDARTQVMGFLETLASDGLPVVPAP